MKKKKEIFASYCDDEIRKQPVVIEGVKNIID
jgi:hypothetical protein